MPNYPIDVALAAKENIISVDLCNAVTGTTYPGANVLGKNTLEQISKEYSKDVGINPNDSKIIFENKRTGSSTSNRHETVDGLGLQDGDVLSMRDNAGVAGNEPFEIDLMNKVTGANYPGASVYATNTLGQLIQEYGSDVGVNPNDSKILFENKRTGDSTSDTNETISGLNLQAGDVLSVSDNAGVAGEDIYEIDLLNKVTGTNYPGASVYPTNTLGQLVQEYGVDIGVNPNNYEIFFTNERTGNITNNSDTTIFDFDLQAGDILAMVETVRGIA